ncbi:MAG: transcription antitermination factor NusB [Steroidobacteraceae bacterium]
MSDTDSNPVEQPKTSFTEPRKKPRRLNSPRARTQARRCVMQALYQWQMTEYSSTEILAQFMQRDEYKTADPDYFQELLVGAIDGHQMLSARVSEFADRPWVQMDPIERAVLLLGMYELVNRLDVPYRVVVNEAVELTKQFGATDGYKYINALLDRVAREIRAGERRNLRS